MGKFGFEVATEAAETELNRNKRFPMIALTTKAGPSTVRFIMGDGKESVLTFKEHWVKFNCGWSRQFSCPDFGTKDKNCILCNAKPGSVAQDTAKVKHLFLVIDRKDDTLKVLNVPSECYNLIVKTYKENDNTLDDRDYVLEFVKRDVDGKTVYNYTMEGKKPSPITKNDLAIVQEQLFSLSDAEPRYDEKEIGELMVREEGQGGGGGSAKNIANTVANITKSLMDDDDDDDDTVAKLVKETKKSQTAAEDSEDSDSNAAIAEVFKRLKINKGK